MDLPTFRKIGRVTLKVETVRELEPPSFHDDAFSLGTPTVAEICEHDDRQRHIAPCPYRYEMGDASECLCCNECRKMCAGDI